MMSFDFEFEGPVVEWRGPAPFYFVAIPAEESADIKFAARGTEYWGQVPVIVRIGGVEPYRYLFLGPSRGRPDIQQITVQVGHLGDASPGARLPVEVLVDGARWAVVRARPSYDEVWAREPKADWLG